MGTIVPARRRRLGSWCQTAGHMLIAVAHDIRSLHNVGAIFRTADGAGFDEVVLSGYTGGPPDPRIAKVALGAEEAVAHRRVDGVDDLLRALAGYWVVVLEQHPDSVPPGQLAVPAPPVPVALVACEELHGAPAELLQRADAVLELPMRGAKESLNVSVAFGIAAYAIAAHRTPEATGLRSRVAERAVRPGVLTHGVTRGETPDRAGDARGN
jgi:23S rRNA (guanosine2251-2'-O)-methyltransferase